MKIKSLIFVLVCFMTLLGYGQDLVYKPINPAFGGDTFNYQWLLSSAEAQNTFKDAERSRGEESDIERFTQNLNNQVLGQISRSLFQEQFGKDGLREGTYTFGTLYIEIFPSADGLVVDILDTSTGDRSQVIIPN
ncbi:curli production assembly/transport component CsgF [Aquimarina hainanensis]|uniref:Curli production assembly/transport component CsgF n=1 Tax=Aquimarina hainanensis TaxID=1578017 RepID=A0ABW5N8Z9_9FLAO|nr:curli production assembly/transport component CsgF [Aquimarina sp. TRL1]QKX03562.1 curli assembly protein CsgF [Aquimarina sp. TRL1]